MADLIIELTPAEREQIEAMVRERGYESARDYVRALIEQDVTDDSFVDDDDTAEIEAGIKQAWREIKRDDVIPVEQMWKLLDDE